MIRLGKTILGLSFGLTLGLSFASAQNKNEALNPNASLRETIDWLKTHIPYSYVVPMNKERGILQREAIGYVQARGCTVSYEITTETMRSPISGDTPGGFTQERWTISLDGINPQTISVEPAKGDRAARLVFSSFDPHGPEWQSKIDSGKSFVSPVEPAKVIWHSTRMDDHPVRNGEGFVSWTSFSVRNEMKGQAIAEALRHGIGLCRQTKRP